jgi:hypothetical protein
LFLGPTWILFPVLVMLTRKRGRSALASAETWQLRAVIVRGDEMAQEAQSALLSEPDLGYQIVDVICPTEPALRQSGGQWRDVLVQRDADLLVLALDANDTGARELTESLVRAARLRRFRDLVDCRSSASIRPVSSVMTPSGSHIGITWRGLSRAWQSYCSISSPRCAF